MRVVLLGPPGAGKGTQAKLLAARASIPHISTGEMLRAAIAEGNPLGSRVEKILAAGDLVPDDLMVDVIRERLAAPDCSEGFLLDGFPRTLEQAQRLTELLGEIDKPLQHAVLITVPDETVLRRVRGRAESGSGRSDDSDEIMKRRLAVYRELTEPVIAYYNDVGLLKLVNGESDVEEVSQEVLRAIGL